MHSGNGLGIFCGAFIPQVASTTAAEISGWSKVGHLFAIDRAGNRGYIDLEMIESYSRLNPTIKA